MGRSGSPKNGGGRELPLLSTRSAIITGSRMKRGGASGCSGQGCPMAVIRRAGMSMACSPDLRE